MLEYSKETHKEFERLIQTGYVLLEFYANWCGTCRSVTRMLKHVDTLKMLKIVRVDIDLNKDFMKQYDILGVPVLMLLFNGVEVMRLGGSLNFEEFKEWIHRIEDFKELS